MAIPSEPIEADQLADYLDAVPTPDLMAAVARRKENQPYESEDELLAAESSGWIAILILREGSTRGKAKTFASVVGPYKTKEVAQDAVGVMQTNHRLAARKRRTDTILVRAEVKPCWKEPS